MDDAVRRAKEAFVTGHSGGFIADTSLIAITTGLAIFISHLLKPWKLPSWQYHILDISIMFTIPLLSSIYTPYAGAIIVMELWIFLLLYMNHPFIAWSFPTSLSVKEEVGESQNNNNNNNNTTTPIATTTSPYLELAKSPSNHWVDDVLRFRIPAISRLRAGLFILTAVAILAVDFPIFPRTNAKTEEYGTGLMDIGVGGFLLCNALVHPLSRAGLVGNNNNNNTNSHSFLNLVIKPLHGVIPLFLLSILRFVVLTVVNYQTHVTEYGVHWNFYCTLGCVMIFCSLFHYFMTIIAQLMDPPRKDAKIKQTDDSCENNNANHNTTDIAQQATTTVKLTITTTIIFILLSTLIGLALMAYHHQLLSTPFAPATSSTITTTTTILTLRQWIFGPDRSGLLAQNKEGVFSLFGYFALAIIAIAMGRSLNLIQYCFIHRYNLQYERLHQSMTPEDEFILQYRTKVTISRFQGFFASSLAIIFWFLTSYTAQHYDQVSRRLCNLSFCFWCLHVCCVVLTLGLFPDMIYYLRFNPTRGTLSTLSSSSSPSSPPSPSSPSPSSSSPIPLDLNNRFTRPWNYDIDMILSLQEKDQQQNEHHQRQLQTQQPQTIVDVLYNRNSANKHQPQPQRPTTRQQLTFTSHQGANHIPDLFNPQLATKPRLQRPKHRETAFINNDIYHQQKNRLSVRPTATNTTTNNHNDNLAQLSPTTLNHQWFAMPTSVLEGINSNALKYFIITNLGVGITNFSISTIDRPDSDAFVILLIYLIVTYLVTALLPIGRIVSVLCCRTSRRNNNDSTTNHNFDQQKKLSEQELPPTH